MIFSIFCMISRDIYISYIFGTFRIFSENYVYYIILFSSVT